MKRPSHKKNIPLRVWWSILGAVGSAFVAAGCINTQAVADAVATKLAQKLAPRQVAVTQTGKQLSGDIPGCGSSITIDFSNGAINVPLLCYAAKNSKLQWTVTVGGQPPAAGSDDLKFSIEFDTTPFQNNKTHIDDRDAAYPVLDPGAVYAVRSYSILYKQHFVDPQIIIGGGGN